LFDCNPELLFALSCLYIFVGEANQPCTSLVMRVVSIKTVSTLEMLDFSKSCQVVLTAEVINIICTAKVCYQCITEIQSIFKGEKSHFFLPRLCILISWEHTSPRGRRKYWLFLLRARKEMTLTLLSSPSLLTLSMVNSAFKHNCAYRRAERSEQKKEGGFW